MSGLCIRSITLVSVFLSSFSFFLMFPVVFRLSKGKFKNFAESSTFVRRSCFLIDQAVIKMAIRMLVPRDLLERFVFGETNAASVADQQEGISRDHQASDKREDQSLHCADQILAGSLSLNLEWGRETSSTILNVLIQTAAIRLEDTSPKINTAQCGAATSRCSSLCGHFHLVRRWPLASGQFVLRSVPLSDKHETESLTTCVKERENEAGKRINTVECIVNYYSSQ